MLFILNEKLIDVAEGSDAESISYVIKPISYAEYDRQMSKSYGKPLKRQAWRLFQNQAVGFDVLSEVIPRADATGTWKYRIRYVKRPRPIILEDLTDGLSIDGMVEETSCELNPIIHLDILHEAVRLAYMARSGIAANREQQQPNRQQQR